MTGIGAYAFSTTGLTDITLPASVTDVGVSAFRECASLKSATIYNSGVAIGENAFQNCASLTLRAVAGSAVQAYAEENGIPFEALATGGQCGENVYWTMDYQTGAVTISGTGPTSNYYYFGYSNPTPSPFTNNSAIRTVVIEEGVTAIGDSLLGGCPNLTSVSIPGSVTRIGQEAFRYCPKLLRVDIPEGVTTIGHSAFRDSESLKIVTLPNTLTRLEYEMFRGCTGLQEITIPGSVTELGSSVFNNCQSLSRLTIRNGLTTIPQLTFYHCDSLQSLIIPESVTALNGITFMACGQLSEVTVLNREATFGSACFYACAEDLILYGFSGSTTEAYALEKGITFAAIDGALGDADLTLPAGLQVIGEEAFSGVAARVVCIPDGVTSLGGCAFADCPNLIQVRIPGSVTSIADSAFDGCPGELVIFGEAGSYAETYAAARGYAFSEE